MCMCRGSVPWRSLALLGRHLVTNIKKKKQWRKIEMRFPRLHIHKICFSANLLSYLSNYVQCHTILSEQKF